MSHPPGPPGATDPNSPMLADDATAYRLVPDPVLVRAWKEALLVFGVLAVAATYTIVVCGYAGYGRTPESLRFVFGFPDWIFYGVVLPWGVCILCSTLIGAWIFQDDDLGDEEVEAARWAIVTGYGAEPAPGQSASSAPAASANAVSPNDAAANGSDDSWRAAP